jgi:Negative regulator of sigma F
MNCETARNLLGKADREAEQHLRTCPDCRAWHLWTRELASEQPRPEEQDAWVRLVVSDLAPAAPSRSRGFYTAVLLAAAAVVIAGGVRLLGTRGWAGSGLTLRLYLAFGLLTGLGVTAALLTRLMIPGELLRLRPPAAVGALIALVLGAGALYPVLMYPGFGHAVAACLTIGFAHSIPTAAVAVWVLRRGFVLSRAQTCAIAGQFAGLTGLGVLFIFCPHLDAGHFLLAHAGMMIACTLVGALTAFVLERRRPA